MEGRCRSTTSTACTGLVLMGLSSSRGSGMLRPVSTSWSMCQLTRDTNLMETLNGRSFPPSPGSVTSRSTWGGGQKESRRTRQDKRRLAHRRLCLLRVDLCVWRRNVYVFFFYAMCLWCFPAHPCGCHRQWVGCVQALLSIVDWPAIPKDCHLKVLHHRVNHLPAQHTNKHRLSYTVGCEITC